MSVRILSQSYSTYYFINITQAWEQSVQILSQPSSTYSFINITQVWMYVCEDSVGAIFYLLFLKYNASLSVCLCGVFRGHILRTLWYI
jgi:hypothetical protein